MWLLQLIHFLVAALLAFIACDGLISSRHPETPTADRPYALAAGILCLILASTALYYGLKMVHLGTFATNNVALVGSAEIQVNQQKFDLRSVSLEANPSNYLSQLWPFSEVFTISDNGSHHLIAPSLFEESVYVQLVNNLDDLERSYVDFHGPRIRRKRFE